VLLQVSFQPSLPHLHVAAVPFHLQPKFRDFMRHFSATVDKFVAERPWVRADARWTTSPISFCNRLDPPSPPQPSPLDSLRETSSLREGAGRRGGGCSTRFEL